jgi:hypothetical protein
MPRSEWFQRGTLVMSRHNPELKRLSFLIEVNRQRLEHALRTENQSLAMRTLSLLTQLHSTYFNESRKVLPMKPKQTETKYLVFSDAHEDGAVMTATELRELRRGMTKADLACHVAVVIDAEMEQATEQVLLLEATEGKINNSGKPKRSA